MKYGHLAFVVLFFISCHSNKDAIDESVLLGQSDFEPFQPKNEEKIGSDTTWKVHIGDTVFSFKPISADPNFSVSAQLFADSLNYWVKGSPLPTFLLNAEFDKEYTNCWSSLERLLCMRMNVLKKVINTTALQAISSSSEARYNIKPPRMDHNCPEKANEFLSWSLLELTAFRLKELDCL